ALELDNTLAEAHTSLARVLYVYDWDWSGAEKEFKHAIELNPHYAPAHEWYGGYLVATGNLQEAIAERKRGLELDPLSLIVNFELALSFYQARNYDQAIDQFRKTLELDPNFAPVHNYLPAAYEQKGVYGEAITSFQKAIAVRTDQPAFPIAGLGHVYAVSGRRAEAQRMLAELQRLSEQSYVAADDFALIYVGLGDRDKAFTWLNK